MTIWFSSDHHCYHKNIIKHCNRPFSSVKEMVDVMIQNHNKLVKPTDTVYFLGDFAWNLSEDNLSMLINKFNGKKNLLLGNHDKILRFKNLVNRNDLISVHDTLGISIGKQYLWLAHYPHRSWNRSSHGSFHLFGHCHGTMFPYGKSFDVGVDAWNFTPINFDMVVATMEKLCYSNNGLGIRRKWSGIETLMS